LYYRFEANKDIVYLSLNMIQNSQEQILIVRTEYEFSIQLSVSLFVTSA